MKMTITLTGHLYVGLGHALKEVEKRLAQGKGKGTTSDGLISFEFCTEGELMLLDLYTEAALDQHSPATGEWGSQEKWTAHERFLAESEANRELFGPRKKEALSAWLREKFPCQAETGMVV